MEIVTTVIGKMVDHLFDAVGHQVGYLVHYKKNINNLKKEAEDLEDLRGRVEQRIDGAKSNAEQIQDDVQNWVTKVEAELLGAETFLEEEAKGNKRCLKGWCINLASCYRSSKEAKEKKLAIAELQGKGKFDTVSRPTPSPGVKFFSTKNVVGLKSRDLVMQQIMEALEDRNIQIIGICGMGGVGKTTLVTEMGKQVEKDKVFDKVAMAVVSRPADLTKVRDNIAHMLGMTLDGSNDTQRAQSLWAKIKATEQEKKILVILDDVWERLDLVAVGIPFGDDHTSSCKIVLTTRKQDVCNAMDAQKIIPVGELSEEEAWFLFRNNTGVAVESNDLKDVAREVAKECGGLPLALVTVARALRRKRKEVWTAAAQQLKNSNPSNISGVRDVYYSLELSYDYLESEDAKSCFLLCCLFPEDYRIPIEALARYGMGLRLFGDVGTIQEAEGRALTAVSTLIDSFLLLDCEHAGQSEGSLLMVNVPSVRMHDVVRDVAISIASKDHKEVFLVKAGIGLGEWPDMDTYENYTAISLMSNKILDIRVEPQCPKLKTLRLQSSISLLTIPDNFFGGMKELKVLDMSDLHISPLPQSLALLTTLRTLCLNCSNLGDISVLAGLINLEILSLSNTDVEEIPRHINQLSNLRLLDLRDCYKLSIIAPGVISSLRNLEELYVPMGFQHWEVEEEGTPRRNASLTELESLSRLTNLHVCMPNANSLPENLHFQHLQGFFIIIGDGISFRLENFCNGISFRLERNFCLMLYREVPLLEWIKELLKKTEELHFIKFSDCRNILNVLNGAFNYLKFLTLDGCEDVKYLVDNLNELSEISHGQFLAVQSFSKVRNLNVFNCKEIVKLVPSHLLLRLQNLENISVISSNSLACVFEVKGPTIEKEEEMKSLLSLKDLRLMELPELVDIWKGLHQFVSLNNLATVHVSYCPKLSRLFSRTLVQQLIRLENLSILKCDNLEEVFGTREEGEMEIVVCQNNPGNVPCLQNLSNTSVAENLAHLRELHVSCCPTMQEIVEDKEGEEAAAPIENMVVFPCLNSMCLISLASLKCFCPSRCTIEWPVLNYLKIEDCPRLETFGYGVQVTPRLNKVTLEHDRHIWLGDLNATVQHIIEEKRRAHALYTSDDLPKTVVAHLNQGSTVKSMDFHPLQQTLIVVGTNIGNIAVWEVGRRERQAFRNFEVWDLGACSRDLQASLANEYTVLVNRVIWSPDGTLFGVAYSKHIVHIYSYGGDDLRNHLEIEAHVGNVTDLAFSHPNKQLCIITCGEDKAIKVWDAVTGSKQYTFEGHKAPVYSVYPHSSENVQYIYSTAIDGKIKAWLYNNLGSRVDYDAPGHSCTKMAYSADGTRLFSCGTNKDGESYIVEWDESEGAVKRTYRGLRKRSVGIVQFDTTRNRFLAAGDEFIIKFWDMDDINLLTTTEADGGLPASPCIRFNKEGILLAVSTRENGIKILGNAEGLRLIRSIENGALDGSRVASVQDLEAS